MTTLVAGTVHAVASTSQIISGAYNLSRKLLEFLRPWWCARLDPEDAHHLFCIQRQIECLIRPLEFCIIWSRYRDPMSQHTILLVEDTLRRVWNRLHGLQQQQQQQPSEKTAIARSQKETLFASGIGGPSSSLLPDALQRTPTSSSGVGGRAPQPRATLLSAAPQETLFGSDHARTARKRPELLVPSSKVLRWCVEELQIATAQLNLSLATIQAYRSSSAENARSGGTDGTPTISVASLLKASRYLWAMQGRTGDLCLRVGRLFLWEADTRLPPVSATAAHGCSSCVKKHHEPGYWRCVYPQCFFRVVKQAAMNVCATGPRLPASATYIPSILIEAVGASCETREHRNQREIGQPLESSDVKRHDIHSELFKPYNLQNRTHEAQSSYLRNTGLSSTFRDLDNVGHEESPHDFLLVTDHFDGIEDEDEDLLNSRKRRVPPHIPCTRSTIATVSTSPITVDETGGESLLAGSPKSVLQEEPPLPKNVEEEEEEEEKKRAASADDVVQCCCCCCCCCCCSYSQSSEAGVMSKAAIPKAVQLPIEMALQMRLYSEGLRDYKHGKRSAHALEQDTIKGDHANTIDTGQLQNDPAKMTGNTLLSAKDKGSLTSALFTSSWDLQLPLDVSRLAAQSPLPCNAVADTQGPALIWHMPEEPLTSRRGEAELRDPRAETRAGPSTEEETRAAGLHQNIRTGYRKYDIFSNRTLAFLFDHDNCRAPSSQSTIGTTRLGCSPLSREHIEAHATRSRVAKAMEAERCLSPIELLYIARLCFLDAAMLSHGRLKGAPCDRPGAASRLASFEETPATGAESYDGGVWSQVSDELLHELLDDCFLG